MKWPLAFIGKPKQTLIEHKREAWSGQIEHYHVTQKGPRPKLWKPVTTQKRQAS